MQLVLNWPWSYWKIA